MKPLAALLVLSVVLLVLRFRRDSRVWLPYEPLPNIDDTEWLQEAGIR